MQGLPVCIAWNMVLTVSGNSRSRFVIHRLYCTILRLVPDGTIPIHPILQSTTYICNVSLGLHVTARDVESSVR